MAAGPRHHGCGLKARSLQQRVLGLRPNTMKGISHDCISQAPRAACLPLACGLRAAGIGADLPDQNVNVIVAFAAGGIADVIGRLVGQKLSESLKQSVVVENRGGAGGNLAARAVATAAPDGYTLLATTSALAVNETASKNKGYNTSDLRPVAIVAISPDVIAIHPSNPAKDLKEFIANGKKTSFTYGSAGVGTGAAYRRRVSVQEVAKVQSVHVPFTGGAPAPPLRSAITSTRWC